MELEVFEPLMFLSQHPEAPARFARAIEKRVRATPAWSFAVLRRITRSCSPV